jgi:hypothetical protein
MAIGPLAFLSPFALLAILALPVLWWLIRRFPPAPRKQVLPSIVLLDGMKTDDEAKQRTPPFLTALRILAIGLLAFGFARPVWAPEAPAQAEGGGGPLLLVIDNGWTSAVSWAEVIAAAGAASTEAERAGRATHLLFTAPQIQTISPAEALTASDVRAVLAAAAPLPWRPDRDEARTRLVDAAALPKAFGRIVWFSDGLDDAGAKAFGASLQGFGKLEVRRPSSPARAIVALTPKPDGLGVTVRRSLDAPAPIAVAAVGFDGRSLGAAEGAFSPGARDVTLTITAPAESIGRAALIKIVGEASAGASRPADWSMRRPFVGLAEETSAAQPLTQELFYVDRALAPTSRLTRGDVDTLIERRVEAIVVGDAGEIPAATRRRLTEWIEEGGLLLRFAGPKLADAADDLVPARLRTGTRALDGAVAWSKPVPLAPMPEASPFVGIIPSEEALVRRQVLADPSAIGTAEVWARLTDGTPLVTASKRGRGRIVLFHVTANPDWSDLPLTGLWPDLLSRTTAMAGPAATPEAEDVQVQGAWKALRVLDGFGRLRTAGPSDPPIEAARPEIPAPGPSAHPGVYGRGGLIGAAPAAREADTLDTLIAPAGATEAALGARREIPFGGIVAAIALGLLLLDALLAPLLSGRFRGRFKLPQIPMPSRRSGLSSGAIVVAAALSALITLAAPPNASADPGDDPTLDMRLAFIRTGDARLDAMTRAGLEGLRFQLQQRTAVEPGPTVALDPAVDDLAPYPLIYWAAPDVPQPLSEAAARRLDRFLKTGGTLLIDTRDADRAAMNRGARPASVMLRGIDAPPLMRVPPDHVLGKAFYLLQQFPGRTAASQVWVETPAAAAARDGVSSLFVGDADWAAAWAIDANRRPMAAVDGGERQRELAYRFGINLVMVTLTGNYKGDQVHTPALLERLGQ